MDKAKKDAAYSSIGANKPGLSFSHKNSLYSAIEEVKTEEDLALFLALQEGLGHFFGEKTNNKYIVDR